jgi:hypothetical protein
VRNTIRKNQSRAVPADETEQRSSPDGTRRVDHMSLDRALQAFMGDPTRALAKVAGKSLHRTFGNRYNRSNRIG